MTLSDTTQSATTFLDEAALLAKIVPALSGLQDEREKRAVVVTELRAARLSALATIEANLAAAPLAAQTAIRAYSQLTDCLVRTTYHLAQNTFHPAPTPTTAERLAVIAVGGYGRGEMALHSDVDLLFLTPYKMTVWAESVIETMLYILWDLRLKVGHASRNIRDCIRLGSEDFTIRTAMLEQRFLCGDNALATELEVKLWQDLFQGTEHEFIEAKLEEREARHEKQGGQRYLVEPNVKEAKGGLRDLQSLYWIAKYVFRITSTDDLADLDVFRPDEFARLEKAENFLWAVRCHLHLTTRRAMDMLTFDLQVEIAEKLGYRDKSGRRAVEHFMQDYFLHATAVGDLTRIFLTSLEASHAKAAPLLQRIFTRKPRPPKGFKVVHNRLAIGDETDFLTDKLNLLRLFEEGLRTGLLIHPDAMRLVTANLNLVDDAMRNDKTAGRIFLDLLLKHGNPGRALRRMNEQGILAKFIPEFEPIVAMMQFNMYHHYTVDEHTIQCLTNLAQIERRELIEELPLASHILKTGLNRKVLYIALFLHDVGKGRDEDHAILGARISRKVAPRLGLDKAETETVEWLVRHHLLMSDMAQKRDISDPRTIRDFAKAVQTVKRLDLLTVLTVCDIRSVGPETWNNWKATLLRSLYRETHKALETGLEALNRNNIGSEAKRTLRAALPQWSKAALKREIDRHYPPYWQGLHVSTHVLFAQLLDGIREDEIRIDLHPEGARDATRVCFAIVDHPGIFSRLAGALALVGANVVDARSFTSKDGYATAAFWIQDGEGKPYSATRLPRLQEMIEKILSGKVLAKEAIKDRDKVKKREGAFKVPTSITFDNEGSEIYTIIEVDTRDRAGLLYDLTRTLADANIYIASSVVATYGEQVVDNFYVKDMFGLKFYSASKQKSLEKKLREAITAGRERAAS